MQSGDDEGKCLVHVCVCVCGKKVRHDCLEAYVCFAVELFFGLV